MKKTPTSKAVNELLSKSGMNKQEFCNHHLISRSNLNYWLNGKISISYDKLCEMGHK